MMKNFIISNLHKKDINHFTTKLGLFLRKKGDKPFKKLCNIFTNAHIIRKDAGKGLSDDEYFTKLNMDYIPPHSNYHIKDNKNNIVLERYPELNKDEPYIFVCNHTCPEDIETVLNIIDRNAYLVLGSIESLQYNREMYLSFLNGMIPFDIMDPVQRKLVFEKMKKVLKTNSVLIFPEGSHNYNPNKLVNDLFDGSVNAALQTKRKIVIISLIKDFEKNISYIDVSNPWDVHEIDILKKEGEFSPEEEEKHYVKGLTEALRDKMATAVYHIIRRHFNGINRAEYINLEEELRMIKIKDAFDKLKWNRDVFDAEYLVKKTKSDIQHEEIINTISNLTVNPNAYIGKGNRDWILSKLDLENKDVANRMRQYWLSLQEESQNEKEVQSVLKR